MRRPYPAGYTSLGRASGCGRTRGAVSLLSPRQQGLLPADEAETGGKERSQGWRAVGSAGMEAARSP
jgi:hypothetical protein